MSEIANVNQPKPGQDEWQEVKSVVLWQWTQGQLFEGIFVSIEPESLKDQKTGEQKTVEHYYFDMPGGDRCKIRELADLKGKIQPKHLGYRLRIRYEGDDIKNKRPGQDP